MAGSKMTALSISTIIPYAKSFLRFCAWLVLTLCLINLCVFVVGGLMPGFGILPPSFGRLGVSEFEDWQDFTALSFWLIGTCMLCLLPRSRRLLSLFAFIPGLTVTPIMILLSGIGLDDVVFITEDQRIQVACNQIVSRRHAEKSGYEQQTITLQRPLLPGVWWEWPITGFNTKNSETHSVNIDSATPQKLELTFHEGTRLSGEKCRTRKKTIDLTGIGSW